MPPRPGGLDALVSAAMALTLNIWLDDVKDIDNMRLIALRYEMEER
jgi:hypothetical protein